MRTKLLVRSCVAALLAASTPAFATFHLMKIVELFPGTAASPSAQYVVIQMFASGQNLVGGHAITVFNAAGTLTGTFTFPGNVSNGANQAKILIATTQAESFFGLTADLVMSPGLLAAGGKACWAGTIDCVAWGNYSGSSTGVGTPFNANGGLASGRAVLRRLNIAGSSTTLDAGDDTDNSANDFVFGSPAPRNNAGALGTVPMSTCGNGLLEGLEQCDDGNLANGDGCSSMCMLEATVARHPRGDYNGDGRSDVLWRNGGDGRNSIWLSANSGTPQAVTTVNNFDWIIAGIGDFDGDGKADILWRNSRDGRNSIWRSANSATTQLVTTVNNFDWRVVGVADFDGDGKADILWRNFRDGRDSIWRSANSATTQPVTTVNNFDWRVVGVADFDGDGKSDILWRNFRDGRDSIWRSANSATTQLVTTVNNFDWIVAGIGDFNGDRKADILWRNNRDGRDSIWRSANSTTPQAVTAVTNLAWKVAMTADFDGDGKSDIFWRNVSDGRNAVWKAANSATQQATTTVNNLAWMVSPLQG